MTKISDKESEEIIEEAHTRFDACVDYESYARANAENDKKFANGDSINNYQWEEVPRKARTNTNKPCLTFNKTAVHNNLIINDAKQNKAAINIRPIGDGATYEASQIFNDVIRHIETRSNAESVYDAAIVDQVQTGIGYWRLRTDFESDNSFDQEILIERIADPNAVYLDPDSVAADGSDSRFGYVFEDVPTDRYKAEYPEFEDVGNNPLFANTLNWVTKDHIRVAEYFRKTQKPDRLISFIVPKTGERVLSRYSDMTDRGKEMWEKHKDKDGSQSRDILIDDVIWYKIAGNRVIDKQPWLGKYIPLIPCVGTKVTIDGRMDRFGNTRAMIDPQRLYNYNSSNYVEMVALQPRAPFIGPLAAIEGLEEYYKTANIANHSYLPYKHIDEDGNPIEKPERSAPPQLAPAYIQGMEIAEKQMMMVTGQYQAQMGENENAKSGVAINARQRQGDRSTYHYIDNQALAIRYTGKQLVDLIPKIYDTERVLRIRGLDGSHSEVTIDPNAPQASQKHPQQPDSDDGGMKVARMIFNPSVGIYDVLADVGPDYATRRIESANAMMQIVQSDKNFMSVAGDLFFKTMDFPLADQLAQRWSKIVPPNLTGDAPDPKIKAALDAATQKVEQMQGFIQKLVKEKNDRDRETDIKAYQAETQRRDSDADVLKQIDNAKTSLTPEEIQRLVHSTMAQLLTNPQVPPDASADAFASLPGGSDAPPSAPPPNMLNGGQ